MPERLGTSVGLLGGSFNPVHNGHLRMAIEVGERLGLERVDLMPAKVPPHKGSQGLLDFELRVDLLRAAVAGVAGLGVSDIEGRLPVPSYSYATLARIGRDCPGTHHVFVLGAADLLTLPSWHRGLELPLLTDIVVVDRMGLGSAAVAEFLNRHWTLSGEETGVWTLKGGRRVFFVSVPRIDISASMVRDRFCAGRELSGLVPDVIRQRMMADAILFTACWK